MDKILMLILIITLYSGFFSCGEKKVSSKKINLKNSNISSSYKNINSRPIQSKNNKFISNTNKKIVIKPPPLFIENTFEKIDPLSDKYISLSARNSSLRDVLYIVSKDLGLNLVVSPEVDLNQKLTANFNQTSAREVLKTIEDLTGIYFEVRDNILYVKELQTKIFKLPYVHAITEFNANLGGDVLGSVSAGAIGGGVTGAAAAVGGFGGGFGGTGNLTGNFQLNFQNNPETNDFYRQLEENIQQLLSEKGKYTINKFTGTITVTDRRKNVEQIAKFIAKLKKELKKQVLIEAKIVEVNLSDEFQFGVDWRLVFNNVAGGQIVASQSLALSGGYGQILVTGADFASVLNALSQYSKLETLSNPRIRVLNGQSALISTGVVTPFWERQVQTVTGTATTQSVSYIRSSVLDGILLGVSPYIEDDGSITLNIVPVSTNIRGTKQLIVGSQVQAEAPVLEIKEAGTTIRVKDGSLVIIGGLITRGTVENRNEIPGLSKIPLLGNLFKSVKKSQVRKELIIFLKPKIIQDDWE